MSNRVLNVTQTQNEVIKELLAAQKNEKRIYVLGGAVEQSEHMTYYSKAMVEIFL